MNRNQWAPVAAVAAVLAVVAGVSMLSRDGRTSGPPLLRLAAGNGSYAAVADSANGARAAYKLVGKLPEGPASAHVRELPASAAAIDRVRALAVALGETAAPTRVKGAWKSGVLTVTDQPGNPWTYGATCGPDTPVSSDGNVASDMPLSICGAGTIASDGGTSSGIAVASPPAGSGSSGGATGSAVAKPSSGSAGGACTPTGTTGCSVPGSPPVDLATPGVSCLRDAACVEPTIGACPSPLPGTKPVACDDIGKPLPAPLPPRKVLTQSQVLAATVTVRHALGLDDANTRVEGLSVVAEPLAGSLPTSGMATVLQLSDTAKLVSASGWLSIGREGDLYPLRSARKALDSLPIVAMGAPCSIAGCPEGPAITGARLGLSLVALDKGASDLVPAWLFTVKGSPVPLVSLAVADQFLGGPEARTNPGAEPGVTKPGGTEPGGLPSAEPTQPGTTDPGPDGSAPPTSAITPPTSGDRQPFGFDGAYADADPKVLVVRYGDSGSCPSQSVKHEVVEQPDRVIVTLTRTAMPADQVCTMDYRAMLVRVSLKAPLGGREVMDGSRKEPVPLSTGTPPLG